jgi:hypothetical protein
MSLLELMVGVGILGIVTYFVVETLKTGTLGQKQLQAQDDSRTLTDNMVMLLGDPIACQNTFINTMGVNPAFNYASSTPQNVNALEDGNRTPLFQVSTPPKVYGNKSLQLISIQIGGSGTDVRTMIPYWQPSPPTGTPNSGTAFAQVKWQQTGTATNQSGPATIYRYFLVNFVYTGGVATGCSAVAAGGANGYWSLAPSGGIYNTNGSGNGNVGVGTETPAGPFEVATNAGATHDFVVTVGGAVGIGTASPGAPLHLSTSATAGIGLFQSSGSSNSWVRIQNSQNMVDVGVGSQGPTAGMGYVWSRNSKFFIGDDGVVPSFFTDGAKVGIGTVTPAAKLEVNGDVQAASFISSSDERLKADIRTAEGLGKLLQLRGVAFRWIKTGEASLGVIAQEVERVFPELVATNRVTGFKAVKYESLIAPLIEGVKELYGMVRGAIDALAAHEKRLAALEASNARKDAAIRDLTQRLEAEERAIAGLKARLGTE